MVTTTDDPERPQVISYLTLRRCVGWLGILLPFVLSIGNRLLFGAEWTEDSISAYYGTEMRNVFVGVLCAIGLFLFSYKGYESKDDIAGDIACVFAVIVAFCPHDHPHAAVRSAHFAAAAGLFLTFAYFSIGLFTKSKGQMTDEKRKRNRLYRICGGLILGCIALLATYKLWEDAVATEAFRPFFWLEALALWAFGLSWLVKGDFLLADDDD